MFTHLLYPPVHLLLYPLPAHPLARPPITLRATSFRLGQDVQELSDEIEKASALRKKEKEDFEAAQEELEASIDALKKASKMLG